MCIISLFMDCEIKKPVHNFPARRPNGKDIVVSQSDTINQHA